MKILQAVQENFESVRISRDRVSFGLFELKHYFIYCLSVILPFIYIVDVAETPKQYVEASLLIAMSILLLIVEIGVRYHSQIIFTMIDDFEQAINKS